MDAAFVKIWSKTVGAVAWDSNNQIARFEFDKNFINYRWELSPIKMPLSPTNRIYSFPESRSSFETFKGLPGLLADSLPDKYGNHLINQWLLRNKRPENSLNPVELLCFIGNRGMGALEYEPPMQKDQEAFDIEINSLVETVQEIMTNKAGFISNLNTGPEAILDIIKIGTSAGGMRSKAIIAYNDETGEVKSGQTNAPKGFEHWIIKLDGVEDLQYGRSSGYGRIELAYYHMARDCGIDMMESRIHEEGGRAHFMTKRFDRGNGIVKHHIQSFCAIQHFDFNDIRSFSYEQLFQTMRILNLPYPQIEQMYRRMIFNVLARNCDDHTKNITFRLMKGSEWELAPAYDICFSYRPSSIWVYQHALSINGKRKDISKKDLLEFGDNESIKNSKQILDEINNVVQSWNHYAKQVNVDPKQAEHIKTNLITY